MAVSNHGPVQQRHSGTVYHSIDSRNPWRTGTFRRLPFLGLLAILGAIVGVAACAAILVYSDGVAITSWAFQPTVYLAIAATVTNILISYALSEGADIAWWRKASQETATVGDLHRIWAHGKGFKDALFAGRKTSWLATACIFVTLAQINGPLLQRASTVELGTVASDVNVSFRGGLVLPDGFSGYSSGRGSVPTAFTVDYIPIVEAWTSKTPIPANDTGCTGLCRTTVKAAGLAVNCSTSSVPFNLIPTMWPNGTINVTDPAIHGGFDVYQSVVRYNPGIPGNLTLIATYKNQAGCKGDLMVETCTLQTATVQYPVVIDGNKSTVALAPNTTVFDDEVDSLWIPGFRGGPNPSTTAGFFVGLLNKYNSTANMRFTGATGYTLLTTGIEALSHLNYTNSSVGYNPYDDNCTMAFTNAMDNMLQGARELMFRSSVAVAALNSSIPAQTVNAAQTGFRAVYRSNYYYLGGAAAVTLLAIVLVLVTFRGYSQIGRSISLSPIEIAKAFNAPILQSHDSNAEVDDLIHEIGQRSVRYGAVVDQQVGSGVHQYEYMQHMQMQMQQTEYKPQGPSVYGHEVEGMARRRLVVTDARLVATPADGETFG